MASGGFFRKCYDKPVAELNVFVSVWHNHEDRAANERASSLMLADQTHTSSTALRSVLEKIERNLELF